jgi:hypothetical protein
MGSELKPGSELKLVHPDLEVQHRRYKMMAIALSLAAFMPAIVLFGYYAFDTSSGFMHARVLVAAVACVLDIPLMLALAYLLAIKRMKFLERSTDLLKRGNRQDVEVIGPYKYPTEQKGVNAYCIDLINPQTGEPERNFVILNVSNEGYLKELPNAPTDVPRIEDKSSKGKKAQAIVDPETKKPVVVEHDGQTLWLSPPAKLFG